MENGCELIILLLLLFKNSLEVFLFYTIIIIKKHLNLSLFKKSFNNIIYFLILNIDFYKIFLKKLFSIY